MENALPQFSRRVENYIKYRPGYPQTIIDLLRKECHLTMNALIADIGSGTGKLTALFLNNGYRVVGIEPDPEMRAAAQWLLQGYLRFTSIAATAEATSLPDHSVDVVTAGQAFHWFDREQARREYLRWWLKPEQAEQKLISPLFRSRVYRVKTFENHSVYDCEGLKGRVLSSGGAAEAGSPRFREMIEGLETLFWTYQMEGTITIEQETRLYYGQLSNT
jgi:SAM-dependent methyltransferase